MRNSKPVDHNLIFAQWSAPGLIDLSQCYNEALNAGQIRPALLDQVFFASEFRVNDVDTAKGDTPAMLELKPSFCR